VSSKYQTISTGSTAIAQTFARCDRSSEKLKAVVFSQKGSPPKSVKAVTICISGYNAP
jgi:hypothetical protein